MASIYWVPFTHIAGADVEGAERLPDAFVCAAIEPFANVVLEADGIDFIEDKQKLTSKIPGVDNFKGITEADSNTIHKIA